MRGSWELVNPSVSVVAICSSGGDLGRGELGRFRVLIRFACFQVGLVVFHCRVTRGRIRV